MAELNITVSVTIGTQYVTGDNSLIYTFDGSQPASFTFPWVASGTVRLDQSDSGNDNHPLIFTTSNSSDTATMRSGIISSGVTYYLDGASNQSDYTNTTTFDAATTRYIEIAPTSETDFYFACWVHGIGMGGIMNMTQDTWGALSWGNHDWGDQDTLNVFPTGYSITSTLGEADVYPEQGWGRFAWGQKDWGDNSVTFTPAGLSMTGNLGTLVAASEQGWGRATWGNQPWGDSNSPVVALSGYSITGALGTLPYAQSEEGWGRDEWGYGNWGENTTTVALTSSLEMTGRFGPDGWGTSKWNEEVFWGGGATLSTTQLSIAALTGLEITGSLSTPTISRLDMIFGITGPSQIGAGIGTLSINNGADHSQGLASLLITGSLGTVTEVVTTLPSGYEATMSVGSVVIDDTQIVDLTGIEATGSVGSTTVDDMSVGLSGLQATGSVGAITPADIVMGLSGFAITGALGNAGLSALGYKDIDITGNTSYTYVDHAG